jgi:histidinol-phosphatase (PHP family)
MIYPADYHLHTRLCRHATGEPAEYAAQAVRIGLTEVGFADHAPMPADDFDDWRMRADQLDQYVAQVRRAQAAYPKLAIRLALEIDYLPGYEAWIRELAGRYPWDYLIGSVHYVSNSWAVDNPAQIAEWDRHDPHQVWTAYFKRLTQAAASGLFDLIGHIDLPKKFGGPPPPSALADFHSFFRAAREHHVAIELNTGGLRKQCQEIYPSRHLLNLARESGIPIAFGSDAHAPAEVGLNLSQAVELAQGAGYTQSCRYARRRRELAQF